ncbi:MAG: ribonuclease HI [Flavobacteriales bacterium]|nr:ribonuclease HI [Flavobacteriales bacterium]
MSKVVVHTDGGASGNPGPGGYGVHLQYGKHTKEISQGYRLTTNNRMELLAVIVALEALTKEGLDVEITSDSKYVVDSVSKKWLFNWEKKNFAKAKNSDLWKRFLVVYRKHNVRFNWVKGHSGHPLNELVDELAVDAYKTGKLLVDEWYETNVAGAPPKDGYPKFY